MYGTLMKIDLNVIHRFSPLIQSAPFVYSASCAAPSTVGLKLVTDGAITSLKAALWVMALYILQRHIACECLV